MRESIGVENIRPQFVPRNASDLFDFGHASWRNIAAPDPLSYRALTDPEFGREGYLTTGRFTGFADGVALSIYFGFGHAVEDNPHSCISATFRLVPWPKVKKIDLLRP